MKPAPSRACLVCKHAEPRVRYEITRFTVLECPACSQVYLWPLPDEDEIREMFAELYTTGGGSVPELKTYYSYTYNDEPDNPLVQLYERWLDRLEHYRAPGRLLDIGCGTGLFLAVARRRGWQPFGIDECEEATRHARDHFGLDVWVGRFEELDGDGFDAITGWDIIEHARDPVGLLEETRTRLAPDGVLGLSTPNERSILDVVAGMLYRGSGGRLTAPLEKFYIEQHFLYFSPPTLEAALARAGLETVELRRELTDLRRLMLSQGMRLALKTLFLLARMTGLENRIFAVARAGPRRP